MPRIAYICDRTACEDKCSYPTCKHTLDIRHAKNFDLLGEDKWIEKTKGPKVEQAAERAPEWADNPPLPEKKKKTIWEFGV